MQDFSGDPEFDECVLDDLCIDDEESFRHVGLYSDLKQVLRESAYTFRVLPASLAGRWDRALFLNLSSWRSDGGGDVLMERRVPADVLAHAAWHHLADRALGAAPGTQPSAAMLFLGEAIASAFDLYLVGRLLGYAAESSFLQTQVPAMADAAEAAGLSMEQFEVLLEEVAHDPDRAFADLRELLLDASLALFATDSAGGALKALAGLDSHRFTSLLHHYELANWVLHARAFASSARDERIEEVDRRMRAAAVPIDWLMTEWVEPELRAGSVLARS
jgi:hypothetical protein